ncbi:hypothetical protein UFOVP1613_20 [uncultured Caudovirales phage]|uniref:Major tropism determinant N-terminal domain-containing protein n=1 Tax=uncultured Caudovirales phage TaxID=2100421 RepID=A0A6J5R6K3_9CAUD|nr:hypothetical protein UFOVP1163_22 [uncultured Caudovirales phage]CAB4219271.1 hypothetical protein UFOVP1613_20 [uncultured Caudovirales phage]
MSNTIRIKRRANGGGAGAPTTLANAELAFNEQTNILYYGTGTGGAGGSATSIIAIAGNGAFVDMSSTQTIGGTKTFTSTISGSIDGNAGTATKWATARNLSLTGDGTATLSAVDGSAAVSGALTLATVNSTVGTYTKITINAKGLATAGSQASLSDLSVPTASFSFNSQLLTNLADPVSLQDAATKNYVDSVAQGLDVKASVVVATTANITLSGLQTIDGITVSAGDRVLVKNQTTQSGNGIYVASASAWARSSDANTWESLVSAFTFVEQGTTQADSGWVCTVNAGGTLGTTAVTWAQFSGAGTYSAGNGLALTGSTFSVVGTTDRISVSSGGVDIASTYAGQTSITTLGTVATGTWNATTIATTKGGTGLTSFTSGGAVYATSTSALTTGTLPVTAGGTGATTLTGYVKGSGTSAFTASSTIPNTDITGLGTMSTQNASSVAITGGSITNLTTFDGITIDGGTF